MGFNPQPLSLQTNALPFSVTGQMIELCCEYLSVRGRQKFTEH